MASRRTTKEIRKISSGIRPPSTHDQRQSNAYSQQRMSRMGTGGSSVPRSASCNKESIKDVRPISDRAYKDSLIKGLIEFLTNKDYSNPINVRILTNPSNSDFRNIVNFMIGFLPIKEDFHLGNNFEETFPILMEKLCYPFKIAKSMLKTVGVPHQWPQLLLALDYIKVLIMKNQGNTNIASYVMNDQEQALSDFIMKQYDNYIFTKKDWESILKLFKDQYKLDPEFTVENDRKEQQVKQLIEENIELEGQLSQMCKLEAEKIDSIEKFKKQEETCKRKTVDLKEMMNVKRKELAVIDEQIENKEKEEKHLEEKLLQMQQKIKWQESQGFNVIQVVSDTKYYEGQKRQEEIMIEKLIKDIESFDNALSDSHEKLLEIVNEMKREVLKMNLSKEDQKFIFSIEPNRNDLQSFCNDFQKFKDLLMEKVIPDINNKRKQFERKIEELDKQEVYDRQELNRLHHMLCVAEQEVTQIFMEKQDYEKTYEAKMKRTIESLDEQKITCKRSDDELKTIKDENLLLERLCGEKELELRKARDKYSQTNKRFLVQFNQMMKTLENVRKKNRSLYNEAGKKLDRKFNEIYGLDSNKENQRK